MTAITISPVRDWEELGVRWRALEARVPLSFFQSWSWVGCLAGERYADPVLIEARADGQTVGLALFNRRRSVLALHESGAAALDTPYVEHNGVVGAAAARVLGAALCGWWPRRLVLSGVDDATLAAVRQAARWVQVRETRDAPFADLTGDFLAGRSANTRAQLRRSDRAYGMLAVRRASDVAEAHAFLDEMAVLHQATWTARGKAGAFGAPFFRQFHRALIERGVARGEIDLLRVMGEGRLVGILYNFRFRGQALAYQSGFDYAAADRTRKPGLTSHHAAIRLAGEEGLRRYDFLAGGDRYKWSLSDGAVRLHWVEAAGACDLALASRCLFASLRDRG